MLPLDNDTNHRYNDYTFKEVTGCSSVWLEHCFWEAGAVGSNPIIPTYKYP